MPHRKVNWLEYGTSRRDADWERPRSQNNIRTARLAGWSRSQLHGYGLGWLYAMSCRGCRQFNCRQRFTKKQYERARDQDGQHQDLELSEDCNQGRLPREQV